MKNSSRSVLAFVLVILVLGAAAWIMYRSGGNDMIAGKDRGVTGVAFPRFTIDPDGSVVKQKPVLSEESLAKLPDSFFRFLIFGINPVVLESSAGDGTSGAEQSVVFRADNKPSDLFAEYKEYFDAIGWQAYQTQGALSLVVRNNHIQTTVTIAPQTPSGSLTVLTRKSLE